MADTSTPFDWKHIEQHHYECNWHGYRLTANQDIWKVEHDGLERSGHPRLVRGARVSAARRSEIARSNAEGYAFKHFHERQGNEQ